MANSGHGGPMQQGRTAQGNPPFYSGRNQQIRPGSLPRPPMAATSIGPNHPPNTANMPAYPGNPSLAMNQHFLYYLGDSFTNQQVYQQFQHPFYSSGGNMHSGGAP